MVDVMLTVCIIIFTNTIVVTAVIILAILAELRIKPDMIN